MNGRDYARLRRAVRIAEERYPDEPAEVNDDQAANSTGEQVAPDDLVGGLDPYGEGSNFDPIADSRRLGWNKPIFLR
ncbi:hypothetical protein ACIA8B_14845 [Micromonospora chalcea]